MPLDFPTSPTNGQEYNGYVFSSSVGAWQAKPAAQSPFYTSDTPPGNPVVGDSWFNTNDGTMYIYTYDGNSYQWVEHRSEIARSQVGLVPIIPTSVTVGSGTASVAVDGTVTFTGSSTVLVNEIFTSTFKNYRIHLQRSDTTGNTNWGNQLQIRFAAGGTANSSSNYTHASWYIQITSGASNAGTSTGTSAITTGYGKDFIIDVFQPQVSTTGTQVYVNGFYNQTNMWGQGGYNASASFDGIQFLNNTFTGTFKAYGYN